MCNKALDMQASPLLSAVMLALRRFKNKLEVPSRGLMCEQELVKSRLTVCGDCMHFAKLSSIGTALLTNKAAPILLYATPIGYGGRGHKIAENCLITHTTQPCTICQP